MKYFLLCKLNWTGSFSLSQAKSLYPTLKDMRWYLFLSASLMVFTLVCPDAVLRVLYGENPNGLLCSQLLFLGHIPLLKLLDKALKTLSVKPTNSDHLSLSDISIEDFIDDEIRFTKAEEMRLKSKYSSKENLDSDILENETYEELWDEEPEYVHYTFDLKEISSTRSSLKQDIILYFQTVGIHLFIFATIYSLWMIVKPI